MQKRNNINLFVGPMSINTVNSVNIFTKKNKKTIYLICSRNQIESNNLGVGSFSLWQTILHLKKNLNLIEKGKRKITDHMVVDVVTFSFFLFFNFKVNKPPIQ